MRYDYHRPRTLNEALDLKAEIEGSRYIAGGTDLLVRMRSGHESPRALISLRSIPELAGIAADGALRIAAMTPLTDIAEHATVGTLYPVLDQAVRAIGGVQIRNVATMGGNLCNAAPSADSAPALLVLEADLEILGPAGKRDVPIHEFFQGPGRTSLQPEEILTAIRIPAPAPECRAVFLKKRRVKMDLAIANIAVLLELAGDATCRRARVAAGAVAPVPLRLEKVEQSLLGERITPKVITRALKLARQAISPISDMRAGADYRRHLTGILLERALEILLQRGDER